MVSSSSAISHFCSGIRPTNGTDSVAFAHPSDTAASFTLRYSIIASLSVPTADSVTASRIPLSLHSVRACVLLISKNRIWLLEPYIIL